MATIRKYGDRWRADVQKKGIRRTKTFDSKREAIDWAASTEADILAERSGRIPNKTVGDLLDRYLNEISSRKKGYKWEKDRITLLKRHEIASTRLSDISAPHIARWRDSRLERVSGASVRREWNLLSHAFNIAIREWHWLQKNPMKGVARPKPSPPRDRRISQDEIDRLIHCTGKDPDKKIGRVGLAFLFAIETGMRAGEIAGIRGEHKKGKAIYLSETKNGTARLVPLSPRAMEILDMVEGDFRLSSSQISSLFRKARDMTGIKDLHFHDTRHEAITRLADKLEVLELARMVGIKDLRILMVYYNKTADEIAEKLHS